MVTKHSHPGRRALRLLSVAGGLLALSAAAQAADLPLRGSLPPPPEAPPAALWTGPFAGISAGYGFTDDQVLRTVGVSAFDKALLKAGNVEAVGLATDGFALGGGLGYDLQLMPGSGLVIGVETDLRWTGLRARETSRFDFAGANFTITGRQNLDYLGTVRGRLGYAFDRFLVYGTGGFAYGNLDTHIQTWGVFPFGGTPVDESHASGIATGTVFGGGLEFAAPPAFGPSFLDAGNLTFKVEYLHYDLGGRTVSVNGSGPVFGPGGPQAVGQAATSRFRTEGNLITAGINYRFATRGY